MKILKITKDDLNERNEYIRSRDLEFEGHIEVEASLGWVRVLGFIRAAGRLGIEAGSGIKAGEGIEAGWGIKAGFSILCQAGLAAKLRIFAGLCIWRSPELEEQVIECAELTEGTVCFGEVRLSPQKKTETE